MNCDCINLVETEILRKYEGAFQFCIAETLNDNFSVSFKLYMLNIQHKINIEVVYCPFCGKKVGK